MDPRQAAHALAEGALMGLYRFDKYKSTPDERELETLKFVEFDPSKTPEIAAGVDTGVLLANAVNLCRGHG